MRRRSHLRNGHDIAKSGRQATLTGQMRAWPQKTIAISRDSAHTVSQTVLFKHPVLTKAVDRLLPSGAYEVVTGRNDRMGFISELPPPPTMIIVAVQLAAIPQWR